jgi:iron complex outermembrane recepter protein
VKTSFNSNSVRLRSSAASFAIGLALISTPALAQDNAAPADEAKTEEIVVTGSLIKDPNLTQSTPVLATTADEMELRQSNVAEEVLREIPGVVPNIGSAVNNGNGGASYVDLRGLGSNRNIALLDGDRIAPSGLRGVFDLNNVPLALVDRVDVLTGGAVTTYGADAIAGVVNFVTKRDFAGVEFSATEAVNQKGDGNALRTDLTIGANFDDGRGNAVLSVGYQNSDPVYQGDRDFSVNNYDSFTGTLGGSGTTTPSRFTGSRPLSGGVPNTLTAYTQTGVTTAVVGTNPIGTPILALVPGGAANGGTRQIDPTTGSFQAGFNPFNFNPYNIFHTPFTRYNMYASARYEVSDNVEIYSRGLFSKNSVKTIIAPSGVFSSSVVIPLSNPYLTATARNQFCALNVAPTVNGVNAAGASVSGQTAYVPLITPAACAAAATATSPTDPNYRTVTTVLRRRFTETGPRTSDYETTVFDYKIGARGAISENIDWDVHGSYGQSENIETRGGYILTSRVRDALLATNTTTCLSAAAGCVPLNVFGPNGSITPAMAAYAQSPSTTTIRTSLAQVHATVTGKTGFAVPMAADDVSFAVGGEYRKYTSSQVPDSLSQIPGELGGAGGAAPAIDGGYEVYEAIGELNIPLIQDKPLFQNLTLTTGARYSAYKVNAAGSPKFNATTWKIGGSWEPGAGVKFRANYSRAVRAPNINELFSPLSTGLTGLATDPCAGAAPVANLNLKAICLAQGAPAASIGVIANPTASQANSTGGGNVNLRPETAKTLTLGVVFQPEFARNVSISLDYYDIKVAKAITTPTPDDVINGCFGAITAASASSAACTSIRRDPTTGGLDGDPATTLGLPQSFSNLGNLRARGLDLAINIKQSVGFADWKIGFTGNYTMDSKFQATPTSVDRECTGYYSVNCASIQPKYQWALRNTLDFGNTDISFLWRHMSSVQQEPLDVIASAPAFVGTLAGGALNGRAVDFGHIKSYDWLDMSVRFDVGDHLTLTGTVANLLNKQPPLTGSSIGNVSYNSGNTYPSTYDTLGRRFSVTAKLKF